MNLHFTHHYNSDSSFQVILILKEQNNFGEIESLAHRACRLYQQQGSPEAAGQFCDCLVLIVHCNVPINVFSISSFGIG